MNEWFFGVIGVTEENMNNFHGRMNNRYYYRVCINLHTDKEDVVFLKLSFNMNLIEHQNSKTSWFTD